MPFVVVKYERSDDYPIMCTKKTMKLTSFQPLRAYGDATILSKMKLQELPSGSDAESLVDLLGPTMGTRIPEAFKVIGGSAKYF